MKQPSDKSFKGYTMAELNTECAVTRARIEFAKLKMADDSDRVRKGNFILGSEMFMRLASLVDYADYALIIVKLWRRFKEMRSKAAPDK